MNEELKKLSKLIAENPDMKVVFLIDIESVKIVDRAKYNLGTYNYPYYYGTDELIYGQDEGWAISGRRNYLKKWQKI